MGCGLHRRLGILNESYVGIEEHGSAPFLSCQGWEDDIQHDEYRHEHFDEVKWRTAYQLTPVGIDLGNRFIHFFSELSYGFQGVFTIGTRFTFP